jgi:invasion protein IalB
MKLKLFPIILGLLTYFFAQHAIGQEFFVKKKYRDWAVYSSASNGCFLASKAEKTASYFNSREVLGKNRQNSFVYLSVNKNNRNYSMSYFSDYPLKINISGSMNIDNRKVLRLMALSSNENSRSKHAIIKSFMKEDINLLLGGNRLTIEIQGIDGSMLVDQFSLMGFTKSFNYLLSTCK